MLLTEQIKRLLPQAKQAAGPKREMPPLSALAAELPEQWSAKEFAKAAGLPLASCSPKLQALARQGAIEVVGEQRRKNHRTTYLYRFTKGANDAAF